MAVFYADSSALVKLVREESESEALRAYLAGADLVSSELVLTELPRAVHRAVAADPVLRRDLLLGRVGELVDALALRPLDRPLLAGAGAIAEPALRALDAIHVASAVDLLPIEAFVTYDERQAAVARLAGLRTMAPA
ncbi:MAG: type II toxin-antitoxin system VapC family toxin [Solirubrobacterales bacterium]